MIDLLTPSSSLVQTCMELSLYFEKVRDVDPASVAFAKEILDLKTVLSSIHESVCRVGSSVLIIQTGQDHWENVARSLADCSWTLEALDHLVRPPRRLLQFGGFLGRKKDEIILDWDSEEIRLLQMQVTSCRQTMELSLQMMVVSSVIGHDNQFTNLGSQLERMDSKIEQLLTAFRNDPFSYGNTTQNVRHVDTNHIRVMNNLQCCLLSAKTFVSAASNLIPCGSTLFELDSVERLSNSQRRDVNNLVDKGEAPEEDNRPGSYVTLMEAVDINEDDDPGLDFQLIQNWRHAAAEKIEHGQYSDAAAFMREVLKKSDEIYDGKYYWREETMDILVLAYRKQKKWDDAKVILLQILDERIKQERDKDIFDTMHILAEVCLANDDFEGAEIYGRQVVNGKKKYLGKTHPSFHDSIRLLVRIFEAKKDEISAAGYRPMLQQENKERQSIECLKLMKATDAAAHIGIDYLADLLPDEIEEKWEEIRENIRNRTVGFCGSGFGYTLLHALVEYGQEDAIRYLVDIEQDLDATDAEGCSALHLAANCGRAEIVELLISRKANVNLRTNDGRTPLIMATKNRSIDVVRLLLAEGAEIGAKDDCEWTALHHTTFTGFGDIAELLLAGGADVAIKGATDRTPLHCAASRGREDMVRLLLEKGANAKSKSGDMTALDLAEKYQHERVAQVLRKYIWGQRKRNFQYRNVNSQAE